MTTITPAAQTLDLTYTLTSPLHHGAGSQGNTSLLRKHEVVQPDGSSLPVPYVSGGSIRHGLRDTLAWHLTETLGLTEGTLSKLQADLLWSGGAVTTTGSRTNLDLIRRVDELLPSLTLLGFAAQSDIYASVLRVSDAILVCQENAWRLPEHIAGSTLAQQPAGAYLDSGFGTRHDIGGTPVERLLAISSEAVGTAQMIYDHEILKPGAQLYGTISLTPAATIGHSIALEAALALWAPSGATYLAARASHGWGAVTIDGLPAPEGAVRRWSDHLTAHREDILALLEEIPGA